MDIFEARTTEYKIRVASITTDLTDVMTLILFTIIRHHDIIFKATDIILFNIHSLL